MVYTDAKDFLGRTVTVTIDRPVGSAHPDYPELVYGVNYGYVPGTKSPDGEALDAYVLGVTEPCATFTGLCIGVLRRKGDDDDKLLLAAPGATYTEPEIRTLLHFQEQYFESEILFV